MGNNSARLSPVSHTGGACVRIGDTSVRTVTAVAARAEDLADDARRARRGAFGQPRVDPGRRRHRERPTSLAFLARRSGAPSARPPCPKGGGWRPAAVVQPCSTAIGWRAGQARRNGCPQGQISDRFGCKKRPKDQPTALRGSTASRSPPSLKPIRWCPRSGLPLRLALASEPHTAELLVKRRGDLGGGRGWISPVRGALLRSAGWWARRYLPKLDAGDLGARLETPSGLCDLQVAGR